jgi:hypothetical protein
MNDIPKPTGDVLRRNPERECGTPVGQVNIVMRGFPGIQTISFYCNQPRLHVDDCKFVGKDVIVRKNRDQANLRGPGPQSRR